MAKPIGKILVFFLGFGWSLALGAQPSSFVLDQTKIGLVNKQISAMKSIVLRLEKEIQMARDKNNVIQVNCLIIKLNLTRGLLRACERSLPILEKAFSRKDQETAGLYFNKTEAYFRSAREIEKSIYECSDVKTLEEGTTLVYLRPENETPLEPVEESPWEWDFPSGTEGFPVVPPASPFR